jgi:hypothetical protein
MGQIGGENNCLEASQDEHQALKCGLYLATTPLEEVNSDNLDDLSEEIIWQELAQRSHEKSRCEKETLNLFLNNPQTQNNILEMSYEEYEKFLPDLQIYQNEIKKHQREIDRLNSKILGNRSWPNNLNVNTEEIHNQIDNISGAIEQLEFVTDQIIQTFPFAGKPEVAATYKQMMRRGSVNKSTFKTNITEAIKSRYDLLDKSVKYYDKIKNSGGTYDISNSDKKDFVSSGMVTSLLSGIESSDELEGLSCRIRARYQIGPERFQMGLNVGLVAVSFVPGVGQIAQGIRVASLNARIFSSGSLVARASLLGKAGVSATTLAHGMSYIKEDCFKETRMMSSNPICSMRDLSADIKTEMNFTRCIAGGALVTMPLAGSILPGARNISSLIAKRLDMRASGLKIFKETENKLRSSPDVIFYRSGLKGKVTRGEVKAGELIPGRSYTVIIEDGKLIIGKSIKGDRDGRRGGAGSHITLNEAHIRHTPAPSIGGRLPLKQWPRYNFEGRSGAIRLNRDGTIDISGRHNLIDSIDAAELIQNTILKIDPLAKIGKVSGQRFSVMDTSI